LAAIGISLAGCVGTSSIKFATVKEFCDGLPVQKYAVLGKTRFDQPWIDDVSEGLIAGCNRERPQVRPAEWDEAVPLPKPRPAAKAAKPKKKTIRERLRIGV
jgi:hypothetical protein